MTASLRARLPWLAGPDSARGGRASWRSVPKIDLLPPKRAVLTINTQEWLLVVAAVVALVAVLYLYRDLSDTNRRIDAAEGALAVINKTFSGERSEFEAVEGKMRGLDGEIAAREDQISQQKKQRSSLREAYEGIGAAGPDWGRALEVLLGAEAPGLKFDRVVALPEGEVEVHATATNLDAISRFEAYMTSVNDVLHLRDYRLARSSTTTAVTAFIEAR